MPTTSVCDEMRTINTEESPLDINECPDDEASLSGLEEFDGPCVGTTVSDNKPEHANSQHINVNDETLIA